MATQTAASAELPVLIIGAGISGLVLAQRLRREGIPFRVFERDADLATRGLGWGLTLHWSLPALRAMLPDNLIQHLPDAYVDRAAVDAGASSTFPFFDLTTGEMTAATPKAPQSQRIRVTRERLRQLLATDIDIEWEKPLRDLKLNSDSVTAMFEDGSSVEGRLLVACDGAQSRVRRLMFTERWETYEIPVRVLGVKLHLSPAQAKPIQNLDPFFLQGTASKNNSFAYISLLDAPGNNAESSEQYTYQLCVSWPYCKGFLGESAPIEIPGSNAEKLELIRTLAATWAEPFRTLALSIPENEIIKGFAPQDFPPPPGLHSTGQAVLMGDAFHAMAMYRGEGANHAIVDVLDFSEHVVPHLKDHNDSIALRAALVEYEDVVADRTRPGVLASRQACMDAHDWPQITSTSPLLTKREMNTKFGESA